jgi:YidC/Oxa1 family membrane protein insertase
LSDLFFWILKVLHNSLGVSWAWAIVLLTVIVRVVLVPLTWRQIKSMRAMQALQPQIKALQEKYKDDRETLNQKTMEFYRENKVSPFGSCLPLLLQLPVFFGLYYMLREQGLAGGAFAPPNPVVGWLWINDITKFDYLLMFLYIASQFVASWQTSRKAGGQQKMIAYFMPIIVGIFMFFGKWPSGLFIYWFTSNLWTIAQQYVAEKVMPAPVAAVATSGKAGGAKGVAGKGTSGKATSGAKAGAAKPTPAKTDSTKVTPSKATTVKPAEQTGGKSSGQQAGKKGKTAGGQGQRPNRGTGSPKGSG